MKKMYNAPETAIVINKGKLDFFNASRDFSAMVDSFANSKMKVACIDKECKKMVNARLTLIEEKTERAKKETYVNQTELDNEIADLNAQIIDINDKKKRLVASILENQYNLTEVDTNVWCAYREYMSGDLAKKDYVQAIGAWFENFNVKAYAITINSIIDAIGMKKASSGQIIKSNGSQFIATLNEKAYLEMFYRVIADMAAKAGTIKPFDFEKSYFNA